MKISVITVCFNSAATIAHTLRSVREQDYPDIEHIVIDGGSSDATMQIVTTDGLHVAVVVSEPDRGIYDAMNKGLEMASGEVVGFLNSDDFYANTEVLSKVANIFQNPAVDACYADLVYVTEDNSRVIRYWKSKRFISGDFAKGWCPAHPTFYVRKSVVKTLGLFDLSYKLAADMEFMVRYLERGKIRVAYIPDVLVRMRVGGATNKNWTNVVKQNLEIFAALRKNAVPFSIPCFAVNKLIRRSWQFVLGNLAENR